MRTPCATSERVAVPVTKNKVLHHAHIHMFAYVKTRNRQISHQEAVSTDIFFSDFLPSTRGIVVTRKQGGVEVLHPHHHQYTATAGKTSPTTPTTTAPQHLTFSIPPVSIITATTICSSAQQSCGSSQTAAVLFSLVLTPASAAIINTAVVVIPRRKGNKSNPCLLKGVCGISPLSSQINSTRGGIHGNLKRNESGRASHPHPRTTSLIIIIPSETRHDMPSQRRFIYAALRAAAAAIGAAAAAAPPCSARCSALSFSSSAPRYCRSSRARGSRS